MAGSEIVQNNSEEQKGTMFVAEQVFAREAFMHYLNLEIKRARRYQNFFSVMRFELELRDNHVDGIKKRESSLKSLLKLLREEIRETDILGQTRENEVMVLLPYCDCSGADVVNMRLSGVIRDFYFGNEEFNVKCGLACFPVEATDMLEILKKLVPRPVYGDQDDKTNAK